VPIAAGRYMKKTDLVVQVAKQGIILNVGKSLAAVQTLVALIVLVQVQPL